VSQLNAIRTATVEAVEVAAAGDRGGRGDRANPTGAPTDVPDDRRSAANDPRGVTTGDRCAEPVLGPRPAARHRAGRSASDS
jgi:hypothetical protein